MAAVAEGFVLGMFASAPGHGFGGGDFGFDGREVRAFVGAVAKRLGSGFPARTPPVNAGFGFLHEGTFLEDIWIAHGHYCNQARRPWQSKSHP